MGLAIIVPFSDYSEKKLGVIDLNEVFYINYELTLCNVVGEQPESVRINSPLTLSLQPKNAYCAISAVTITMGGDDITALVYNNGVISIPSVSGNVVITASASYTLPSGYTILESIGVPFGSRFNTGITPSSSTSFLYKYSVDATIYTDTSKTPHFLSGTNYYAPYARTKYGTSPEAVFVNRCGTETSILFNASSPYTFSIDAFNNDSNAVIINDGEHRGNAVSGSASAGTLWFACYGGNTTSDKYWLKGRVFGSIEICSSGTPSSILVPAKNANNVYGFYDVVRPSFYSSATSVAFTA